MRARGIIDTRNAAKPHQLDQVDMRILSMLQKDCSIAADRIAKRANISPSAVQRRIKRMRRDKTIEGFVAVVDPKAVGQPLTFIAALEIERERKDLLVQLQKWIDREDAVQQAFYVTGTADIILVILCADVESYDVISQHLVEDNPNVRRVTTSITLQVYKRGLSVPFEKMIKAP